MVMTAEDATDALTERLNLGRLLTRLGFELSDADFLAANKSIELEPAVKHSKK